jgi:biotin carboxyl carrier protein
MSTITICTELAGNLWKVVVKPGDRVKAGDAVFIMEVMKTEVHHTAPQDGTVTRVLQPEGTEGLDADEPIIELE